METSTIISLIGMIVTPLLTGAFIFGIMRGTINGLKEKVENLCNSITRVHERVDHHIDKHCVECPGTKKES